MTTKLNIYNEALMICGERILSSLTEARESRYLLDHVWGNNAVKRCLESGQWRFAARTVLLDYDTSVTPTFGYTRAFEKPSDWCITCALCVDEYLRTPLINYIDEGRYWYCDENEIYLRYISDDSAYGGDLTNWPEKFSKYVATYFAAEIILKLTSDISRQESIRKPYTGLLDRALKEAKNKDMMNDPVKFLPNGSWVNSRTNSRGGEGNGNGSSLIG